MSWDKPDLKYMEVTANDVGEKEVSWKDKKDGSDKSAIVYSIRVQGMDEYISCFGFKPDVGDSVGVYQNDKGYWNAKKPNELQVQITSLKKANTNMMLAMGWMAEQLKIDKQTLKEILATGAPSGEEEQEHPIEEPQEFPDESPI